MRHEDYHNTQTRCKCIAQICLLAASGTVIHEQSARHSQKYKLFILTVVSPFHITLFCIRLQYTYHIRTHLHPRSIQCKMHVPFYGLRPRALRPPAYQFGLRNRISTRKKHMYYIPASSLRTITQLWTGVSRNYFV